MRGQIRPDLGHEGGAKTFGIIVNISIPGHILGANFQTKCGTRFQDTFQVGKVKYLFRCLTFRQAHFHIKSTHKKN